MAVTTTSTWNSNLLINYVAYEIRTLEPELHFATLGVRRDVPKGFSTLAFPQSQQLITSAASTITEGTSPTAYQWNSDAYTASLTQLGIVVQVSDILVRSSALEVINSCTRQIRQTLARRLDNLIQTTVNGSTSGVLYAGGKTARASLGAGDLVDTTLYLRGIRDLRAVNNNGVRPFRNGYMVVIMHDRAEHDLMTSTSSGSWIDVARHVSPQQVLEGKAPIFRGAMVYTSPNVQTFSSTVTVYPETILGEESFGWGFWQPITPTFVNTPDSNNPLLVYTSIGGKFAAGVTRFEDSSSSYRIVRLENAVSS